MSGGIRSNLPLSLLALFTELTESRRQDNSQLYSCSAAVLHRRRDVLRPHHNYSSIHTLADVLNPRITAKALDFGVIRIYGINAMWIPLLQQIADRPPPKLVRVAGGTINGHAYRTEETVQFPVVHGYSPLIQVFQSAQLPCSHSCAYGSMCRAAANKTLIIY